MKRIFVYGTLRKGGSNHRLLEKSKFVGVHITQNEYTMVDFGPFPALLEEGVTPITGEVYEIDNPTALAIDRLEGYPHLYQRKVIDTEYGKALVYYIEDISEYSRGRALPIIESGVWEG